MDIGFNILLFIHLSALVVAAATNVVMPILGRSMAQATPEARAGFGAVAKRLSMNSRVAFAILVASGVAMVQVRYGGVEGLNEWFWAKMALVALIVVLMVLGAMLRPGTINPRFFTLLTRTVLLGIVFSAVFAFN
jgi:putative membrane protein